MRCVLGVDSGGTKCDALLVRDDGTVLGWGRSEPLGSIPVRFSKGTGRSPQAILAAVTQALNGMNYTELHIAHSTESIPLGFLPKGHATRIEVHAVTEAPAAYALAGVTCGVVALAGTGSFVHGRTREGRTLHLDGLGPLLGDHGGGYQIGLMAMRAAAQSGWHPRRNTSLADAIYRACGGRPGDLSGNSLISFALEDRDRSEIASLAKIVNEEASAGDRIAREILQQAAAELAATTYDVVDNLGMTREDYSLIASGSIATKSTIFWEHYSMLVREFAPNLIPVVPDLPAVVGVVLGAFQRMRGTDREGVRARLLESARQSRRPAAA
jgi:N-acetylglucosamine kinase-like BadF-type ATPase